MNRETFDVERGDESSLCFGVELFSLKRGSESAIVTIVRSLFFPQGYIVACDAKLDTAGHVTFDLQQLAARGS